MTVPGHRDTVAGGAGSATVASPGTSLDLTPDASDHRRVLAVLAFLRSS